MNGIAYHSLAAFVAHLRALRAALELNPDERKVLEEMKAVLAELTPAEREALLGEDGVGTQVRLRWRAELRLKRVLGASGKLAP